MFDLAQISVEHTINTRTAMNDHIQWGHYCIRQLDYRINVDHSADGPQARREVTKSSCQIK